MSTCEQCWRDAYDPHRRVTNTNRYHELVRSRSCTPEEQAGRDATECDRCHRRTRHQQTGECMACGAPPKRCAEEEERR